MLYINSVKLSSANVAIFTEFNMRAGKIRKIEPLLDSLVKFFGYMTGGIHG